MPSSRGMERPGDLEIVGSRQRLGSRLSALGSRLSAIYGITQRLSLLSALGSRLSDSRLVGRLRLCGSQGSRCSRLSALRALELSQLSELSALGLELSALGSRLSALGSMRSRLSGSRLSALRLSGALGSRLSARRLSALGSRLSALGSRLSASRAPTALGSRLSALGSRLSALGSRLSALTYRATVRPRFGPATPGGPGVCVPNPRSLSGPRSGPGARREPAGGALLPEMGASRRLQLFHDSHLRCHPPIAWTGARAHCLFQLQHYINCMTLT